MNPNQRFALFRSASNCKSKTINHTVALLWWLEICSIQNHQLICKMRKNATSFALFNIVAFRMSNRLKRQQKVWLRCFKDDKQFLKNKIPKTARWNNQTS